MAEAKKPPSPRKLALSAHILAARQATGKTWRAVAADLGYKDAASYGQYEHGKAPGGEILVDLIHRAGFDRDILLAPLPDAE